MSKVIMYHYIKSFDKNFPFLNFLHIDSFKKQIKYLTSKKKFIKSESDIKKLYFKNNYLLTFDDGFKEHLNVAKFLKKKNILGVFFIPSFPLKKKTFLPIHKIHLIFARYSSDEIIKIFKQFKIAMNQNKNYNIFSTFQNQKKFSKKLNQMK